jgi:transcriptional antiterminator RfaH
MSCMAWVVVRTKSQRERYALENCHRQNIVAYCPMIEARRRSRGRLSLALLEPLFPSYMFADVDGDQWRKLLSTYGVVTIVLNGQKPAYISARLIEALRQREQGGVVVLPTLKPGQRIRITSGAFADQQGVHVGQSGHQRIAVLLDVLGGKRKTLIDAASVVAA